MIKLGITGSLASGKSTAADYFSNKKYPLFSADEEVKKLFLKKNFIKKIKKDFKIKKEKNIKNEIKNLIKKNIINLKKLELLIHPLVRKEMKFFIKKKRKHKMLVFEIPLLFESKLGKYFNTIILVNAKKSLRLKRYLSKGGNKKMFSILNKRQISPTIKKKLSDFSIDNNRSTKELKKYVTKIINKL